MGHVGAGLVVGLGEGLGAGLVVGLGLGLAAGVVNRSTGFC